MESQSSHPTVDVAGTISNMQNQGFDDLNKACELFDNSIPPNAKYISYAVDTKTNVVTYTDDADGMDKQGLYDYGTLNQRKNAKSTSHGRYGIGGKHALTGFTNNGITHIISKPKNGSGLFEMEINFKNAIETGKYELVPHKASLEAHEEWKKLAFNPESNGTVQIMYSTPEIVAELASRITTDDITNTSFRFELGCIYSEFIQSGLVLELIVDGKVYPVRAFDRLMYEKIDKNHKQETVISVFKYPNSSFRFYYKDKGVSQYRDCSSSTRGRIIKDSHPIICSSSPIIKVGEIILKSTYSKEWDKHQTPDLSKMGLKIRASGQDGKPMEGNILGGTVYKRNHKQISHFHPRYKSGGASSSIEFIRDARHSIEFNACEIMDSIFNVMINKSKLEEQNIHPDLFGTIVYICEHFSSTISKLPIVEKPSNPIQSDVLLTPAPMNTMPVLSSIAPSTPAEKPKPVAVQVKPKLLISTTIPKPASPSVTSVPTPSVLKKTLAPQPLAPVLNEPKSSIAPIAKPALKVVFSKTDTHMLIHHETNGEIKIKIPYVGQYNITEKYYNEKLMVWGEERFLEWVTGHLKLVADYDSKFF